MKLERPFFFYLVITAKICIIQLYMTETLRKCLIFIRQALQCLSYLLVLKTFLNAENIKISFFFYIPFGPGPTLRGPYSQSSSSIVHLLQELFYMRT